jgi:hypothetical protein
MPYDQLLVEQAEEAYQDRLAESFRIESDRRMYRAAGEWCDGCERHIDSCVCGGDDGDDDYEEDDDPHGYEAEDQYLDSSYEDRYEMEFDGGDW